jgi:hypothetical protein
MLARPADIETTITRSSVVVTTVGVGVSIEACEPTTTVVETPVTVALAKAELLLSYEYDKRLEKS